MLTAAERWGRARAAMPSDTCGDCSPSVDESVRPLNSLGVLQPEPVKNLSRGAETSHLFGHLSRTVRWSGAMRTRVEEAHGHAGASGGRPLPRGALLLVPFFHRTERSDRPCSAGCATTASRGTSAPAGEGSVPALGSAVRSRSDELIAVRLCIRLSLRSCTRDDVSADATWNSGCRLHDGIVHRAVAGRCLSATTRSSEPEQRCCSLPCQFDVEPPPRRIGSVRRDDGQGVAVKAGVPLLRGVFPVREQ